MKSNRRNFLKISGLGVAAVGLPGMTQAKPVPAKKTSSLPVRLGLASYTLRKMNLDDTLAVCQQLDLKHISLKDFHLKLDSTDAQILSLIHISEPTRLGMTSYAVFCLKKKKK